MKSWSARAVACIGVLLSSMALSAGPASGPATRLARRSPTTAPATAPALPVTTAPANRLPTPAELLARIKALRQQARAKLPKVAYFNLEDPIAEKPADFSLFAGENQGITLRELIERLQHAQQDKDVRTVLITMGDPGLNLSQALELRDQLNALRRQGKRSFVYADSYDTAAYLAACGATDVCMLGGGDLEIPGVGFQAMFAKALLDKVHIKADYIQIGEYKGADEEFTRTDASEELRGELNKLADSLYGQIVDTISLSRNLTREEVKQDIDDALLSGRVAMDRGLVDHLVDVDGLRDLLAKEIGDKVALVPDYGAPPRQDLDLSSPFALFSLLSRRPAPVSSPTIAIIYAEGVIVDGSGNGGLFATEDSIGSEDIRQAVRMALRDSNVKGIVIRIDSPGGSALASEVMWQSVRRLAKDKPVIISVGSMAASGGYYLASSGDTIYADPTAIVGSIGVVGGKFVLKGLYDWAGLNTESFTRGRNADLFSSSSEWTDGQRRIVSNWMRDTYDQFTERVMTTRKGKIKDIDAVARGRIFTAKQAKDLGMVDEIGGVQDAVARAAREAGLEGADYDVRVLPPPRTLADFLGGGAGSSGFPDSAAPLAARFAPGHGADAAGLDGLLQALPGSARHALIQQLQEMRLLQQRPVILVTPYTLILK